MGTNPQVLGGVPSLVELLSSEPGGPLGFVRVIMTGGDALQPSQVRVGSVRSACEDPPLRCPLHRAPMC
eukprot:278170-Chlamydomonas_euryale.AAC.2